jgi:riboflavin kinase/FMN adenylyltransferase
MDLYGLTLGVDMIERLRDERRFDGIEALRAQIDRDARTARELLADDGRGESPRASGHAGAEQPGDRSEDSWAR